MVASETIREREEEICSAQLRSIHSIAKTHGQMQCKKYTIKMRKWGRLSKMLLLQAVHRVDPSDGKIY